jgi:hypothetical protein
MVSGFASLPVSDPALLYRSELISRPSFDPVRCFTVDFSITVLGAGFWPLEAKSTEFTIPADIQKPYDRFLRYYQSKHSFVLISPRSLTRSFSSSPLTRPFSPFPPPLTPATVVGSSPGSGTSPRPRSGRAILTRRTSS